MPPSSMLAVRTVDGRLVIDVFGPLDRPTARLVLDEASHAQASGFPDVTVDLGRVTEVDDEALRELDALADLASLGTRCELAA